MIHAKFKLQILSARLVYNRQHIHQSQINSPVQTQCMQERRQAFHYEKDANGENSPESEDEEEHERATIAFGAESYSENHHPKDLRQFCKMKGKIEI